MHAIQTSGNVVRNVTTEAFAGVAADEVYDPRIFAEIIRQWSTINPEFLFLPRKFKIAVSASEEDRAAVRIHDVGLYLFRDSEGELYFKVMVGGGLGRTPFISQTLNEKLPWRDLLTYLEAVLRVFNRYGRRDSKYKARIKILVNTLGIDAFKAEVEQEFQQIPKDINGLTESELSRIASQFLPAVYETLGETDLEFATHLQNNEAFSDWYDLNVRSHKVSGYRSVVISTKFPNNIPGDVTSAQMRGIADIAERFGFGEVRVTHEQNLVLPDIPKSSLFQVWAELNRIGLGLANHALLSDMIVCPGASYCNLATAHSFPVAEQVVNAFTLEEQQDIGPVSMNLSGCINSCAHHHIANIGMLGLNKSKTDHYQITLGGRQGTDSRLGKVLGPAIAESDLPQAIRTLMDVYRKYREVDETFIQAVDRLGLAPFKEALYPEAQG
ncbi:nitrite/sulfite reductase [Marinomonas communis]|uniref:nitrite/sulfite reductase n=1 Tax=Marinomonas communis TaxID=28254 RepID=UPI00396A0162